MMADSAHRGCVRTILASTWMALFCATALGGCVGSEAMRFDTTAVRNDEAAGPDTAPLLRLADEMKAAGDSEAASRIYERVLQDQPHMNGVRTSLGQTMLDRDDASGALKHFRAGIEQNPDIIDNYIWAGKAYLALHQPRPARAMFEDALEKDSRSVDALNGLGVSLDSLRRHQEAQKAYVRALAVDTKNGAVRNNYGLSLALGGDFDRAIAELTPLASDEGLVGLKARQNLALAYGMKGDLVSAARYGKADYDDEAVRNDLRVYGSIERR